MQFNLNFQSWHLLIHYFIASFGRDERMEWRCLSQLLRFVYWNCEDFKFENLGNLMGSGGGDRRIERQIDCNGVTI